jgi:OOP family OmpA-OmpF porin
MKKILLVTGLVCGTVFAQDDFNKLSIDLGWGLQKGMVKSGKAVRVHPINFDLGARYMLNNNFGLKFDLGYNLLKSRDGVVSSNEYKTNYTRFNLQGVANLGHLLNFESFSSRLGLLMHVGAGGAIFSRSKDINPNRRVDKALNGIIGLTPQVKVTDKIALFADLSGLIHLKGDYTYDMRTKFKSNGFDQVHLLLSFGANIYLGKNDKHADWTPNSFEPDMTELNALKARVAKAENDMKDDDNDGVPNYLDEEPGTESGAKVDTKGRTVVEVKVVDMDGDGILDVDDFCPTMPGSKTANGCPDADGDGVYDFIDKCPNVAGSADNNGCPVITKATQDAFKKAEGVQFENGKATIVKKSFPALDNVVKILKENPTYKLDINGHTDNVGDAGRNVTLSKDRAASVKAYLLSKGIDPSRIESNGYGDSQPKASNADAKGRAINRRVEFIIKF